MSTDLLGKQLGNYLLIRTLGHGTFGSVYLGKHIMLENKPPVAIKVLHASLRSQAEQERFFQEARVLDKLSHPHILPILDASQHQGYPFFVVVYASGGSLRDHLLRQISKSLNINEAVGIVSQVGLALQYAHNHDIVHRDLKPENILFKTQGWILLADFGMAIETRRTFRTYEIGTPMYMAPEQFQGELSKKSDQYSLACVTYELLTGRPPFKADDIYATGYKHIHERPVPLRTFNAQIPQAVENVVLKAMAKHREERFSSVDEFVKMLQQALSVEPALFVSPTPVEKPSALLPARISPPIVKNSQTPLKDPSIIALGSLTPAKEVSPMSPRPGRPAALPATPASFPVSSPLRGLSPSNFIGLHFIWSANTKGYIRSSPTVASQMVYVGSWDNKLYAFDMLTGKLRWSVNADGYISSSPVVSNGLVYVGSWGNKLYAFDAIIGKRRWSVSTKGYISSTPALASGLIYAGSWDSKLYAFSAGSGKLRWTAVTGDFIQSSPVVSNGVVYIGSGDSKLYAFDAITGQELWSATTGGPVDSSPTVVKGRVYVGSGCGWLYAFDAVTGKELWSTPTNGPIDSSPAVSDSLVCVGSWDARLYVFDAFTGVLRWSVAVGDRISSSPSICNNVVYVGADNGRLYAFDIINGKQFGSMPTGGPIRSSPHIVDDMLYVGSDDGKLYAFQLVYA